MGNSYFLLVWVRCEFLTSSLFFRHWAFKQRIANWLYIIVDKLGARLNRHFFLRRALDVAYQTSPTNTPSHEQRWFTPIRPSTAKCDANSVASLADDSSRSWLWTPSDSMMRMDMFARMEGPVTREIVPATSSGSSCVVRYQVLSATDASGLKISIRAPVVLVFEPISEDCTFILSLPEIHAYQSWTESI